MLVRRQRDAREYVRRKTFSMEYKRHPSRKPQHVFSIPFIYGMFFSIVFLDVCLEVYHRVCFPLYGIAFVDRWKYIRLDRHKLSYLSGLQKVNCSYCAYANGLFRYASAIAGETERYWCGVKHAADPAFAEPEHHKDFLPYGDERAYKEFVRERAEQDEEESFFKENKGSI